MARNSSRRKYSRGGGGHGWASIFGMLTNAEQTFVEQRARLYQVYVVFGLMTQDEAIEQIRHDLDEWREEHKRIARWRSANRRGGHQ